MKYPITMLMSILVTVAVCRGGEFHAETRVEAGAKHFPESNRWQASVIDANGTVCYRIERDVPYGSPYPSFSVSSAGGSGICLDAFDGSVEFFDANGALLRAWHPFGETPPDHERILKCSLARDRAAILWSGTGNTDAAVALFSADGRQIWRHRLAAQSGGDVQISDDGECILAGSYTYQEDPAFVSELFGATGALVASLPREFRSAQILHSADHDEPSVVMTEGKALYRWPSDPRTESNPLWVIRQSDDLITDVTMRTDGTILLLVQQVEVGDTGIRFGEARLLAAAESGMPAEVQRFAAPEGSRLLFLKRDARLWICNETRSYMLPVNQPE